MPFAFKQIKDMETKPEPKPEPCWGVSIFWHVDNLQYSILPHKQRADGKLM